MLIDMRHGVASDGSPVAIYLALPPGDTPSLIHSAVPPGGSILELGSGPGRITRPLTDLGHTVVAVDNSEEMLSHIDYTETNLADVFELDLGKTYDAVVAGSHLINTPDAARRFALLSVCRRHVDPEGVVLIERYEPTWAAAPLPSQTQVGPVLITFEPLRVETDEFRGRVIYALNQETWTQEFEAANLTEDALAEEAMTVGLHLKRWLNDSRTWACLTPR
jgi:SAM-dependent methyltransferase